MAKLETDSVRSAALAAERATERAQLAAAERRADAEAERAGFGARSGRGRSAELDGILRDAESVWVENTSYPCR